MISRHALETQRRYVERALRTVGGIATADALYSLAYEDGRTCSITRLAAIVCNLREDGWDIATGGGPGELAHYRLIATPTAAATLPAPVARALPDHPWTSAWRCADCGSRPTTEPTALLGDLGRAYCPGCLVSRFFRRVA